MMPAHLIHDTHIAELIAREEERQRCSLNLIASENFTSPQVREATGSVLAHKYAEGLPGRRYYEGCEVVDEVEELAISRAKALFFDAAWANVQPHAGSQANMAVMMAVLKPRDKILGFQLSHGGHLTHGASVNFSGRLYQALSYGVDGEGYVDLDAVAATAAQERPKLIICGGSSYSRDWDYPRLREIADSVGAFLLADIAHPAGLIARGLMKNPFPYCHFITTTTHKTLRGPRGGMILIGRDFDHASGIGQKSKPISTLLDKAVFPGMQGGPHENLIAGKAIAFREASTDSYYAYVKQVQQNAKELAMQFIQRGYELVSGGTDSHLLLIDLSRQRLTGKQAEKALVRANIIVNKNVIPFDTRSPFITSGIRLGTPAITTRGAKAQDMEQIVIWVDAILQSPEDEKLASSIKEEISAWTSQLPLFIA